MSGIRYRTGVVFAAVVLTFGVTAAVAGGWENKGGTKDTVTHENGGKDDDGRDDNDKGRPTDNGDKSGEDREKGKGDRDNGKDNGDRDKDDEDKDNGDKEEPTVTSPSAPSAPTQVQTTPGAPAPLTPLSPQATPSEPGEEPGDEPRELAQAPPGEEEGLAPAAERKKLAETGLHPGLIAVLGALLVGGGALLFRRSFAR